MDRSSGSADTEPVHSAALMAGGAEEERTEGLRRTVTLGRLERAEKKTSNSLPGYFTKPSRSPPSSFYVRHLKFRRTGRSAASLSDLFVDVRISSRLLSFLRLSDIARLFRVSKTFTLPQAAKALRRRRRELVLKGLKPHTRARLWRWVASQSRPRQGLYTALKGRSSALQDTILTDIRRIDCGHTEAQQKAMLRILCALAAYLPDVGYCQSLVFVAAVFVHSALPEEDCFWVLHSLLVNYDFASVVSGGFDKLKLLCFQFDCFLRADLKPVAEKLQQADFSADLYALRWLLTLFSYELPPAILTTLWDLFFLERWKVMIRAGLAFIQTVHDTRKHPSGAELFCLLRAVSGDEHVAREVLSTMHSFKVTQRLLDGLQVYFQEECPPKLHLITENGKRVWQRTDAEDSQWNKTQALLDETLCLEDFTSPGGPLSVYVCPCKADAKDETALVCAICGSSSHSSMYCDQDTEDSSLSSFQSL